MLVSLLVVLSLMCPQVIENGGYIGQEISRMTGMNTIPIIFVNGKLIGGCDSLQACIKNGSFEEELKRSRV